MSSVSVWETGKPVGSEPEVDGAFPSLALAPDDCLKNYGGFLPRQGLEYTQQMKEATTEIIITMLRCKGESLVAVASRPFYPGNE